MDYDENDYDLYEWMDNNILGLNDGEEKEQLISLISEVFERLPSEDRETLFYNRGIRFVAPITINCVAEQIFIDPLSVRDERTTLCNCSNCNDFHLTAKDETNLCQCPKCSDRHLTINNGVKEKMIGIWLVCLSSDILKRAKDESLYTIAHELAHVYLEHSKHFVTTNGDGLSEREIEADKLVIKWGFESELRQTPYNYIYGEGEI